MVALLLFVGQNAFANHTDSLLRQGADARVNDTVRANVFTELASLSDNPDTIISYAARGLALSKKADFAKGKAMCMQYIGLAYLRKNEYDSSIYYYREALHVAEKTGRLRGQAAALLSIADVHYRVAKYDSALEYYKKGLDFATRDNSMKHMGLAQISMGGIYSDLGNYPEATKFYLYALGTFEKSNDKQGISMSLTNIATVYSLTGDHKKALEFINKSLDLETAGDNKEGIIFNLVNIGIVYGAMKDYTKGLYYFNKGLRIADSIGDYGWKTTCIANTAGMYYNMGKYDSALAAYNIALRDSGKILEGTILVECYTGVGLIYEKKGQMAESIKFLLKGMNVARQYNIRKSIYDISSSLSEVYEKKHDYLNALQYHKLQLTYKDSLYSEKSDKRMQQLQFDYELEKKQREIEMLNKTRDLSKAKNEKQNVISLSLAAGLLLLAIIILLQYRRRIFEKRTKEKIVVQKEEIQLQATKLEELNRFKDKIFSVLSHDLRGPVNAFTSTMMMLNDNLISADEFNDLKPEVTKQLTSLNMLLDNVLMWAKSHMSGEITAKPGRVNIYHLCRTNIEMLQDAADRKHITLSNNVDQSTYAVCDNGQMEIVIRNLLMNAIKYTNPQGTVSISAASASGTTHLSITDNGVGMTQEQTGKLFTPTPEGNTYGTQGEKGIGLGMLLCYEFIKANRGSIAVTSEVNKGTTVTVTLPA